MTMCLFQIANFGEIFLQTNRQKNDFVYDTGYLRRRFKSFLFTQKMHCHW